MSDEPLEDVVLARLVRNCDGSMLNKCVLRYDGVHFIERDGVEQPKPKYDTIKELNRTMQLIGCPLFRLEKQP